MNRYPPLVFWGGEALSTCPDYDQTPILEALLAAGWPVAAVVIRQGPAQSRKARPVRQRQLADDWGFDLITVDRKTPLEPIAAAYPARLGVLAGFGRLLSPELLDSFDSGIVNVHPSLLPAYRGPTPVETAIVDGRTKTGVSLIKTVAGVDSGPIYAQAEIGIQPQVEKSDLTARLGRLAAELLVDKLPAIAAGKTKPRPQDEARAGWTRPLTVADRDLNWQQPAGQLERRIRAQAGWPGSLAEVAGQKLKVLAAEVVDPEAATSPGQVVFDSGRQLLVVGCRPGLLGLSQVQLPDRKPLSAAGFYHGYGRRSGLAAS